MLFLLIYPWVGVLCLLYKNCFPTHQAPSQTLNVAISAQVTTLLARLAPPVVPRCEEWKEVRGHLLFNLASLIPRNKQTDDDAYVKDGRLEGGKMSGKLIRQDHFKVCYSRFNSDEKEYLSISVTDFNRKPNNSKREMG